MENVKYGEWICKDFDDNEEAFPESVKIFKEEIQDSMQKNILYRLRRGMKYLEEHPFDNLNFSPSFPISGLGTHLLQKLQLLK